MEKNNIVKNDNKNIDNSEKFKVNPTFLIHSIDIKNIKKLYEEGYFFREIPKKTKLEFYDNMNFMAPSSDHEKLGIYSCIKNNHCREFYATSGHIAFSYYRENGNFPKGGRCFYCLCDFEQEPLGYPLNYEKDIKIKNKKYEVYHYFWIEGIFCSFECVYGYIKMYKNVCNSFDTFKSVYSNQLILLMFKLCYPNETLKENPDFKLLKSNGGSLERKDWQSGIHKYKRTGKLFLAPIKAEYLQN